MDGQPRLIAGAMSGTSADGVDAAIVAIYGRGLQLSAKLLSHFYQPYSAALKRSILTCRLEGSIRLDDLAKLGREISLAYAQAVRKAAADCGLKACNLTAVAVHGQTLYHAPPCTIQWVDPALIAAEVGSQVISDFRRADCAAGGQGAPLVPFADYVLFRDPARNRLFLNIGGIANITWLPAAGSLNDVVAFDTGPGNCLIDHVSRQVDPAGPGYDVGGTLARQGRPLEQAIKKMLMAPFFQLRPPKSTDVPAMINLFESIIELRDASPAIRAATATAFTAASIADAISRFVPGRADELIVSGGGTRNLLLMEHLRQKFAGAIRTVDELGLASEAKEAVAFALLGAATLDGVPANVPSATGATRPVVLGSITPKP